MSLVYHVFLNLLSYYTLKIKIIWTHLKLLTIRSLSKAFHDHYKFRKGNHSVFIFIKKHKNFFELSHLFTVQIPFILKAKYLQIIILVITYFLHVFTSVLKILILFFYFMIFTNTGWLFIIRLALPTLYFLNNII